MTPPPPWPQPCDICGRRDTTSPDGLCGPCATDRRHDKDWSK